MKTIALQEAVGMIPDGASLMIGGFMAVGTPERLVDELVRQRKRNLTVIANDTAMPGRGIGKLVSAGLITGSNVFTLGGNVVVALPLSITRESLRPYVVGGLGWMHISVEEIGAGVLEEFLGRARNSVAMNIGGGAVGFITPRTGFRFELRQFRSLERDTDPFTGETQSLLSFWRVTAGVVIKR